LNFFGNNAVISCDQTGSNLSLYTLIADELRLQYPKPSILQSCKRIERSFANLRNARIKIGQITSIHFSLQILVEKGTRQKRLNNHRNNSGDHPIQPRWTAKGIKQYS